MTKNKSLKRALLMSIISILVCSAMLVGATFAWFSDSVSTGVNTIISGNLKVDIQDPANEYSSLVNEELFDIPADTLWEPGMMFVSKSFVIANIGTVALQYSITTTMVDEVLTSKHHGLSEVISYKVVAADDVDVESIEDTAIARANFWAELEEIEENTGILPAGVKSDELVVVLYWEPTANDNLYNVADVQLKTNFSISVYATQAVDGTEDSVGPDYDAAAGSFKKVHDTIVNGVDLLNNGTEMGKYAHLSDLVEIAEGHYVSYVTLDTYGTKYDEELEDTRPVTIGDVYYDIAETLFGEVTAKYQDIYSIKVTIDDLTSDDPEHNPFVSNGEEFTQQDIVWGPCAVAMVDYLVSIGETVNSSTLKYILEEAPVSMMAGHRINVTMTTMDGTVSVYTLDFSLTVTESTEEIHNTITEAVGSANEAFEDMGLGDKISLSDLAFVDGKYATTITFAEECELQDVVSGYLAISEFLSTLIQQMNSEGNLGGVIVGGANLGELAEGLENVDKWAISFAIAEWGYNEVIPAEDRERLAELDDLDRLLQTAELMLVYLDGTCCDVELISAEGESVVYTLAFVLNADLSGEIVL